MAQAMDWGCTTCYKLFHSNFETEKKSIRAYICTLFTLNFISFLCILFRCISFHFVLIAFCFAVFRFISTSFCTLVQPNEDFYFLLAVFPQLYFHMIAQRKKVIGGAVRPKSEWIQQIQINSDYFRQIKLIYRIIKQFLYVYLETILFVHFI